MATENTTASPETSHPNAACPAQQRDPAQDASLSRHGNATLIKHGNSTSSEKCCFNML